MTDSTKKRILIFSLAYHPIIGGAEIAVKEITDRIPEIEFDMVTLKFDESHPEYERIGNVNVYRIKSSKLLYPIEASLFGKKLHKERNYTAVWSIMAAYAGFATLFFKASFPEVRYILTLQEGDPIEEIKRKTFFVSPVFRKIFLKADSIQAISHFLADYARAVGYHGKITVIPNGVDVDFFSAPSDIGRLQNLLQGLGKRTGDIFLITTSRLVKKNAIDDSIRALSLLPSHVSLLVIGTGPDGEKLRELARDLGLGARVKFIGFVPYNDIPLYLHASDIFVRASRSEGFGNSFVEAFAAGLPVIATPVGGIVDFVFDPERNPDKPSTGLFAEPKKPESIARQVMNILDDEVLRDRVVKNAKKLVRAKYEWDIIAKAMKEKIFSPAAVHIHEGKQ